MRGEPSVSGIDQQLRAVELATIAVSFRAHRLPVWCYSCRNGAAMLRCSALIDQSAPNVESYHM